MNKKCSICRQPIQLNCDYNQGRCPNRPPAIQSFPKWLLLLAAPFIIVPWIVMNPRKVWQQAKKDWNIK